MLAVTAAVLAMMIGLPQAAAGGSPSAGTQTSTEAWYLKAEACGEAADCSLLPPASVYPENTLHVAAAAGDTRASTYLELDAAAVGDDATFTGGTLTLPVDTTPGDGTLLPELAKITACVVTDRIPKVEGALTEPPETDCKLASAPAEFSSEPEPAFTIDLGAFASQWANGETPRLAILPAPEAKEAADTWHVAFWGKDHTADEAVPITAELNYESGADDAPLPTETGLADSGPMESGPPTDMPSAVPQEASAPEPAELKAPAAAEPPDKSEAPQPQAAPVPPPSLKSVSYAYPIAWLMPLLLLIGMFVVGRVLTKKLEPVG